MNTVLGAFNKMKEDALKAEMKREEQSWKTTTNPCQLGNVLSTLTKHELDTIRKNYDIKGISSLNKGELAAELARQIPHLYEGMISQLDQERYGLVKKIVKQSGYLKTFDIPFSKIDTLKDYSILFPGNFRGDRVLFIPTELVNAFLEIDSSKVEPVVKRNTTWITLTHGLLFYYGVIDSSKLLEKLELLTKAKIDSMHFFNVISFASKYYGQASLGFDGMRDLRVSDERKLLEEHQARPALDYYPFSKDQLLAAGQPNYVEKNHAIKDLLAYLEYYYEMKREDLHDIASKLVTMINQDALPAMVIQYLQTRIEIPNMEILQELTEKVMYLYNNTRMWVLKGHTPTEVAEEERKHLRPLPKEPFQSNSNVVDLNEYRKIGRNDPCPCGSGKKHKKCCGK